MSSLRLESKESPIEAILIGAPEIRLDEVEVPKKIFISSSIGMKDILPLETGAENIFLGADPSISSSTPRYYNVVYFSEGFSANFLLLDTSDLCEEQAGWASDVLRKSGSSWNFLIGQHSKKDRKVRTFLAKISTGRDIPKIHLYADPDHVYLLSIGLSVCTVTGYTLRRGKAKLEYKVKMSVSGEILSSLEM